MEKAKPQVRPSARPDAEAVVELSLRTTRASYSSFLGVDAVEAFIGSGAVESFIGKTIERGLVVTLGGEMVGYAVASGHHIDQLIIDEQYQRRGLGSLLLAHLESLLFEEYDALDLESFRGNDRANDFYQQMGWRKTGEYRDEEHGVEMVAMQKEAG